MKKVLAISSMIIAVVVMVVYTVIPADAAAPSAVVNLTVGSGDESVFLNWSAPSNGGSAITDYIVSYRESGAGSWTTFSDGTSTSTTTTVTGLTNETRYEFKVQAVNADGTGGDSNIPDSIPLKKVFTDNFESYITSLNVNEQNGWTPGNTPPSVLWEVYSRSGSQVVAPDDAQTSIDYREFAIHQNVGDNVHIGFDFNGFTTSNRFFPQMWFRRVTGTGNDQGYVAFIWPGSGGDQLVVWKHVAGSSDFPNVADEPLVLASGTTYRVEAEMITNASDQPVLKIWVYPKSGSRGAPALTYTDTSGSPFLGNYVGLGFATQETLPPSSTVWYDNVDIYGTEAGPAAAPLITSTATAGSGEVLVTWDPPFYTGTLSVTDYNIQYKLTSDTTWTTFSDGTSTNTNATVTGLTNGQSYDFRVRTVNGFGTGAYSPIARGTPATSGTAPSASSVTFSGYPAVGKTLTGSYTYSDPNSDPEGSSTFRWLRASTSGGSYSAISGATNSTYVLQAGDLDQYIKFEVTPVATVAPTTGDPVLSSASSKVFSEAAYYHILSNGQSLSTGYSSTGALTTTQPYNNLMLTNGVEATSTPLIALRESGNGENSNVETPSSAMANTIAALDEYVRPFIVGLHGHNGAAYSEIKKGTSYYARGITQATNSNSYVTGTLGGVYYPRAVTFTHGETDYDNGVSAATYEGYLNELQNDYQTDLNALAGTNGTIPLFVNQMNAGLTGTVAVAQLNAHRNNPGEIILVGPKYQMAYTGDRVHLTNSGSKYLGELMGKVMKKVLLDGDTWDPLMPTNVDRVGNLITVSFNIPTGTLAFDTTNVALRPNYGFEFAQTGGNSISISSVALVNGNTQAQITLSGVPTGTNQRLRYAYTCTGNHTGAYDFLCATANDGTYVGGNVRDTDTSTSQASGSTGLPLYDWLVAFDEPINGDSTPPTVSSVTSSTANGSYRAGQTVATTINFSEAVTTSGTVTVNFNSGGTCTITASNASSASCTYTIGSGQNANPLNVSSISGTINDQGSNTMVDSTPVTNLSASKTIIVDTTLPTVSSITSSTPSGSYRVGQTVAATVTFSEAVTTSGTVTVNFNSGGTCTITASSSSTASCTYTIGASDSANPLNVSSITGTIDDAAENTLTNSTPATNLSASKTIVIDTTLPTVNSITSTTASGSYTIGQAIPITVNFSEAVTTSGTVTVTLNSGGSCVITASSSAAATCTYTVASSQTANPLNVSSITGTIDDAAGNTLTNTTPVSNLSASKTIIIDTTVPTVSITSSTASGTYTVGAAIQMTATFSENITTSGTVTVNFNSGGTCTISATDSATATCTYTVASGNSANPLNVSSISGIVQDQAGNSINATPVVNLSASKTIVIDTTLPTVNSITSSTASGTYTSGDVVQITVTFSEAVTTSGTVTVNFNSGGTCTITASNSSSASCNYTIGSSDNASPLDVSNISGTIVDQATNVLTNSTPAINLSISKTIIVDNTAPTVSSITSITPSGTYTAGESIQITVMFSENITTSGTVTVNFNSGGTCTISATDSSNAVCTYTIASSQTASPLNVSSITGTIDDAAGNTLTNSTPATNLSASKTIVIDTTVTIAPEPRRTVSGSVPTATRLQQQPQQQIVAAEPFSQLFESGKNVLCPYMDESLTLRENSNSEQVQKLQAYLRRSNIAPWLRITGFFGPYTRLAVNRLQALYPNETYIAVNKKAPTGIASYRTLSLINRIVCPQ